MEWKKGQRAVIDRARLVTVERVLPSGRVIAGGRTFNPNGMERGGGSFNHSRLELLTPEVEAAMALAHRGRVASNEALDVLAEADRAVRGVFSFWGSRKVATVVDVEMAEKLATTIRSILDGAADTPSPAPVDALQAGGAFPQCVGARKPVTAPDALAAQAQEDGGG